MHKYGVESQQSTQCYYLRYVPVGVAAALDVVVGWWHVHGVAAPGQLLIRCQSRVVERVVLIFVYF